MGCVRRGKKQKQGPKTLTKEEATGSIKMPAEWELDDFDWSKGSLFKRPPRKLYEFYGSLLGEEQAESVRKNFPPDDVKNLKEIPREF